MAKSPRTVIIGATGQLGSDLMRAMRDWQPVGLTRGDLDVADGPAVSARLDALGPEVVVNCAAFHRVDECEARPEEAFRVNAVGARHVAAAAARLGALVLYVSTDYVFDGGAPRPYVETDPPRPINVYGASKLAGEHVVSATTPTHLIVRVASLFGVAGASGKGGNFVETMIRKARAGDPLRVIDDVVMSPTATADAAETIRRLIVSGETGIVHVTNEGACSWYEFARAIFSALNVETDLQPTTSTEWPSPARRPSMSALDSARLAALGIHLPSWHEGLRRYLVAKGHLDGPIPQEGGDL